jgi:hypothetical protein
MTLQPPKNRNYCATVVALSHFVDLPNCSNVKAAIIYGNQVIVGKDTQTGAVGVFFPVETQILREFLASNNLYRKPEFGNLDPEKKGFFEEHGRVKALKFRGHKSEGFWIPLESLSYLGIPLGEFVVGIEFDEIGDHPICKKYVPRQNSRVGNGTSTGGGRKASVADNIVDGQFRFHPDTDNLRKNVHKLTPDMFVSISDKWHGTSAVFANVLVKRPLSRLERIARWFGVKVQEQEYGFTWSSRRVIKGVDNTPSATACHFYPEDIWGRVAAEIKDCIPKGITLYGEIVGYTGNGAAIQSMGGLPYNYGCQSGTHRFIVYRVTSTNADGKVVEFSWLQMKEFCTRYGLEMVKELWFGRAGEFGSVWLQELSGKDLQRWQKEFLQELEQEFVSDGDCLYCNNGLPAEGIVVKVDRLDEDEAYKLKNFRFLEAETKSLDAGELDLETQESETEAASV